MFEVNNSKFQIYKLMTALIMQNSMRISEKNLFATCHAIYNKNFAKFFLITREKYRQRSICLTVDIDEKKKELLKCTLKAS